MGRPRQYVAGCSFLLLLCAPLVVWAEPSSKERLKAENRLAIVRELAYEYATAVKPLPASEEIEEAVKVNGEGKIDEEDLRQTIANRGAAIHAGEAVQVTAIEFERDHIVFELNGGGKESKKWWERIRVSAGTTGGPVQTRTEPESPPPPPGAEPGRQVMGSWVVLTFPHLLPDMTPEEVKGLLAGVLEFKEEKSAAVRWIDTIDEKFREAIKEQRAMVGMNRKMVLAALGRPKNKVRETENGVEKEDWIYGYPPMVTFVTFVGDEVVDVKEYK